MNLDKDGLLSCAEVSDEYGRFFYEEEEIYAAAECGLVIDQLLYDRQLWRMARIRFHGSQIRVKRAPIIAVPFSRALEIATCCAHGFQKSMYEVPDWTRYSGKAVIATMLAHTSAANDLVELQAWQFLDVSDETFYVHCIIDKKNMVVIHLDGATMRHTEAERNRIRNEACKLKGYGYQKHFRLDGRINIDTAAKLMDLYFPIEPLTKEFIDILSD